MTSHVGRSTPRELLDGFEVIDEWRSRTSTIRRLRHRAGAQPDRVWKVCDSWTTAHADASVTNAALLARIDAGPVTVVEVHGSVPSPPSLVTTYVEGTDLSSALGVRGSVSPALLRSLGRFLASWHRQTPHRGAERIRRWSAVPVDVRSAGDFAPYNFRLQPSGTVVYLEPPAVDRRVAPHRDLAWFLDSLAACAGSRADRRLLGRAFLSGYAAELGRARLSRADQVRIHLNVLRRRRARALRRRRTRDAGARAAATRPG